MDKDVCLCMYKKKKFDKKRKKKKKLNTCINESHNLLTHLSNIYCNK